LQGKNLKRKERKRNIEVQLYKNAEREEKKVKKDLGEEGIIYRGFGEIVPFRFIVEPPPPPPAGKGGWEI
jgi:hypothetical protein